MKYNGILNGEKVILRNIDVNDCNDEYLSWMNDYETNYYMETRYSPQTKETIRTFVESIIESKDSYLFAIIEKTNNKHIGNIKIGPVNNRYKWADISYFIGDKKNKRKGYAVEAIKLICVFGFDELNLHRIQAGTISKNIVSEKALLKAGFIKEGSLREKIERDGIWYNHNIFGMVKEDSI